MRMRKIIINILREKVELLTELVKSDWDSSGEYIVSKGKYVFRADDVVTANMAKILDTEEIEEDQDIYDVLEYVRENPQDNIILLSIKNEELHYDITNDFVQNPFSSKQFKDLLLLLKKDGFDTLTVNNNVMRYIKSNELSLDFQSENVIYIDSILQNKTNFKNTLPDKVYHGTSTKWLKQILKTGIKASEDFSNFTDDYQDINHSNIIFFTPFKSKAIYYADKANDENNIPIILEIETKGLDPTKVIVDFDVYNFHLNNGTIDQYNYEIERNNLSNSRGSFKNKARELNRPEKLDRFAYIGRLSPKYIHKIHYNYTYEDKDFDRQVYRGDFKEFIENVEELQYIFDNFIGENLESGYNFYMDRSEFESEEEDWED